MCEPSADAQALNVEAVLLSRRTSNKERRKAEMDLWTKLHHDSRHSSSPQLPLFQRRRSDRSVERAPPGRRKNLAFTLSSPFWSLLLLQALSVVSPQTLVDVRVTKKFVVGAMRASLKSSRGSGRYCSFSPSPCRCSQCAYFVEVLLYPKLLVNFKGFPRSPQVSLPNTSQQWRPLTTPSGNSTTLCCE
jgi:hypothetical protein